MKILNLKTNELGRGINVKHFAMWMDPKKWAEGIKKCRNMVIYYDCSTESEVPMLSSDWNGQQYFGGYDGLVEDLTKNNNTLVVDVCGDYESIMENKDPLNQSYLAEVELQKLSDSSRIIRNYDPLHWHKYVMMTFWLTSNQGLPDEDYSIYTQLPTSFKRLFVSQNMRAHFHRCTLIDYMAKHDLIKHGYITWAGTNLLGDANFYDNPETLFRQANIVNYPFQYWTPEVLIYDDLRYTFNEEIVRKYIPTQISCYRDAFMDIVSESNPRSVYFTEKTVRPIMQLRPFLVQSCVNAHAILKEKFGYEQYDELFDYSFDSTQSTKLRTDQMLQQVNRYKDASMDDLMGLYKDILPKLVHNFISLWKMPEKTAPDFKWTEHTPKTAHRKNERDKLFNKLTNTLKEQKLL